MERLGSILIVTPAIRCPVAQKRSPLVRLALPKERVPKHLYSPSGTVWWAEVQGTRIWLRGYSQVERVTEEALLDGGASHRLVWHLSPQTTERLTWPGATCPRAADITRLVAVRLSDQPLDSWVREILPDLAFDLEKRRSEIAEHAWSYDAAFRHYARLVQTTGLSQTVAAFSGDPNRAWTFARLEFARAELVQLDGRDAYEVAAAVLAGYKEMATNWKPNGRADSTLIVQGALAFQELDVDAITVVESAWCRSGDSGLPTEALERSDKHHQLILRSLAQAVLERGLRPTYSRFIDLRVVLPSEDVFFEVKTATCDNFLHQVRLAMGQLLEYRFRYQKQNGSKPIRLAAVIENAGRDVDVCFAREFLSELRIAFVLWDAPSNSFSQLAEILG